MKSGVAHAAASGVSQGRLVLQSNPITGVGVASYDLTTAAMNGDWGTVAEMSGGLAGGLAIGKGVSKYGGYGVAFEDIGASGPMASQKGAIRPRLVTPEEGTASGGNGVQIKARSLRTQGELQGKSEGGPGTWGKAPTRTRGQEYQEQITGVERGTEYNVNDVWFDGYDANRNVLLDAKDWSGYPPPGTRFWENGVLTDAQRQLGAAGGTPIEWVFSNQSGADAVAGLLNRNGITGIITKVVPKAP
jgi:hypothetical protein